MGSPRLTAYNKLLLQARRKSLASFADMDYRLASVIIHDNVEWINDSKSVDLQSTHYALSVFNQPVYWVLELDGSQQDYSILEDLVRHQVKSIICYGVYNSDFEHLYGSVVEDYKYCSTMAEAVEYTRRSVGEYDVVLFSSGCYPLDGASYVERGKLFNKELKEALGL